MGNVKEVGKYKKITSKFYSFLEGKILVLKEKWPVLSSPLHNFFFKVMFYEGGNICAFLKNLRILKTMGMLVDISSCHIPFFFFFLLFFIWGHLLWWSVLCGL